MPTDKAKPWYREFWLWFVFTPPLISIVIGLSLLTTAIKHGDSLVVDHHTQAGRSLHRDDSRQRAVTDLGLEVRLVIDREDGLISVLLEGLDQPPLTLNLLLAHPTLASRDVSVVLHPDITGIFRGQADTAVTGRYYLRLQPDDDHWLVTREVQISDDMTVLALTSHD